MLSGELYAFLKVIAENSMRYDMAAAIFQNEKVIFTQFIKIFHSAMKRLREYTGFY